MPEWLSRPQIPTRGAASAKDLKLIMVRKVATATLLEPQATNLTKKRENILGAHFYKDSGGPFEPCFVLPCCL